MHDSYEEWSGTHETFGKMEDFMNTTAGWPKWLVIFAIFLGYCSVYAGDNGGLKELERQYDKGVELMEEGDYEGAKEAFTEVVNSPVQDSDRANQVQLSSWNNLGSIALEEGNLEYARIVLTTMREKNPEWGGGDILEGRISAAEGNWEEAEEKISTGLSKNPEDPSARNDLVTVLLRSEKTDAALEVAEEGTRLDSEDVQAVSWYLKGLVEEEKGDISSAESAYEKTIEIEPEHTQALLNFGNIKADKGQAEEAVELLERALRTEPYNQKVKYNLGRILTITQMEYKRGVRLLQAAAKGRGEAAQKARKLINKLYKGARQIEAREKSGLQIEKSVLAKKAGGTWHPVKDASFQKGDVVGLIFLNVRGFEKGKDGLNWMDLDIEVKSSEGEVILEQSDMLGEKGHVKMKNNLAESPVGSFNTTPEMESGKYTIKLTVKDKVGGDIASESKSFTLE